MEVVPAIRVLRNFAVTASANAGQGGQSQRDFWFHLRVSGCDFYTGEWALHINRSNHTIAPLLDKLATIPESERRVQHLLIEQSFGAEPAGDAEERARLVGLEERSLHEIRRLLEVLSPRLLTLTIVRTSIDPTNASLRGEKMFDGIRLPVLQELSVWGPEATTAACELPLRADALPSLRRLHIPSDMLRLPHNASLRLVLPHLAHLAVAPLRARATVLQLRVLHRCGRHVGVFARDRRPAARRSPTPLFVGSVEVTRFAPLDAEHVAEADTLHEDLLMWKKPEVPDSCVKLNLVQQDVEPSYEELVAAVKMEWLAKRRQRMIGS